MCCGSLGQKMLMSPENLSRVRTKFWDMKMLWCRERRYVAIPNMEVWLRLARLAPDVPDGWSFADGSSCITSLAILQPSTNPVKFTAGLTLTGVGNHHPVVWRSIELVETGFKSMIG